MLVRDIGHIRSACQRLDIDTDDGREVLKVFFNLCDDDIDMLNVLVSWVSGHGLEHYYRQQEYIEELEYALWGDEP